MAAEPQEAAPAARVAEAQEADQDRVTALEEAAQTITTLVAIKTSKAAAVVGSLSVASRGMFRLVALISVS